MTLLALVACTPPGLLRTLQDELAADAVADAEPGLRLFVGVGGMIAETCGLDQLSDYVYSGVSAEALAATTSMVAKDDVTGEFTWEQEGVGVDGALGSLSIDADDERTTWSMTYQLEGVEVISGALTLDCDASVPEAVIGGSANRTAGEHKDTLSFIGAAPVAGVLYSPSTSRAPDAGQARWAREATSTKLTLDDASTIDAVAGTWPGVASGRNWTAEVVVALP
jgi:hypothetical protein